MQNPQRRIPQPFNLAHDGFSAGELARLFGCRKHRRQMLFDVPEYRRCRNITVFRYVAV